MKKKIITLFLLATMVLHQTAYAYELPFAFWALNDSYNQAVQAGDNQAIITYGTQIADLIRNEPANEQTHEIMGSRLDQAGLAYERIGNYPQAAALFSEYIPHAIACGWDDGVKIGKAKVLQYTPSIELYTQTNTTQVYYGARNEPEQGVLYGRAIRDEIEGTLEQESLVLVYSNFGDPDLRWVESTLSEAQKTGSAVEIAWNFAKEHDDVLNVKSHDAEISQMISLLNEYSDVPVFLRIAAEMNVWQNRTNPTDFVDAFRYISSKVRPACPNTAVVWSVSHASAWDIEMNDYYPGDEYVDWVGISAYMMPYFQGKNNWSDAEKFNEVVFSSGNSSEPVKLVDEVIKKYGDRKPIMLAECGASHLVRPLNLPTYDFANISMRRMYQNLPMVYPQIKAMAYFDSVIEHEVNDYALSTSSELEKTYHEQTKSEPFIQNNKPIPSFIYAKLGDTINAEKSILPIHTYVHTFGTQEPYINYYIDGQIAGGSGTVPYSVELDLSKYSVGTHTLSVVAEKSSTVLFERKYTLNINSPISLSVNNELVETDIAPTIQDDRTLVPIRTIAEKLSATVNWNEETREVSITKGDVFIRLIIGSRTAVVNGSPITLDVPAKILGGRTLVPVRAVATLLESKVDWDNATRTVKISNQ